MHTYTKQVGRRACQGIHLPKGTVVNVLYFPICSSFVGSLDRRVMSIYLRLSLAAVAYTADDHEASFAPVRQACTRTQRVAVCILYTVLSSSCQQGAFRMNQHTYIVRIES